jgi:hypothetical protein
MLAGLCVDGVVVCQGEELDIFTSSGRRQKKQLYEMSGVHDCEVSDIALCDTPLTARRKIAPRR